MAWAHACEHEQGSHRLESCHARRSSTGGETFGRQGRSTGAGSQTFGLQGEQTPNLLSEFNKLYRVTKILSPNLLCCGPCPVPVQFVLGSCRVRMLMLVQSIL